MGLWRSDILEEKNARGVRQKWVGEHALRGKGDGDRVRGLWEDIKKRGDI